MQNYDNPFPANVFCGRYRRRTDELNDQMVYGRSAVFGAMPICWVFSVQSTFSANKNGNGIVWSHDSCQTLRRSHDSRTPSLVRFRHSGHLVQSVVSCWETLKTTSQMHVQLGMQALDCVPEPPSKPTNYYICSEIIIVALALAMTSSHGNFFVFNFKFRTKKISNNSTLSTISRRSLQSSYTHGTHQRAPLSLCSAAKTASHIHNKTINQFFEDFQSYGNFEMLYDTHSLNINFINYRPAIEVAAVQVCYTPSVVSARHRRV